MKPDKISGFDPLFMRRAIELAKKGEGFVNPNPLVGAVIVKDGQIIGEGYHRRYGDLHAERDAFKSLSDPSLAKGADLYVTLEPCCHHGKQPPCTLAVKEHGIKRVFVGSADPNPLVSGKGNAFLREQGIEVYEGCLKEECDAINTIFFHYITKKRPYVTMKYAMTADGKIATVTGKSKWISGEASRVNTHKDRNRYAAILVGLGTVLSDDPMLNVRLDGLVSHPVRVVLDSHLSIPVDSKLVKTAREIPLYLACVASSDEAFLLRKKILEELGVKILQTPALDGRVDLNVLMNLLGAEKLDSLLIEGGGMVHAAALKAGIVNHCQIYLAPKIFGGRLAPGPVAGDGIDEVAECYQLVNTSYRVIGDDLLMEGDLLYPCLQES